MPKTRKQRVLAALGAVLLVIGIILGNGAFVLTAVVLFFAVQMTSPSPEDSHNETKRA
jgi:hypothetical protein